MRAAACGVARKPQGKEGHVWPARIRWPHMGAPMMPSPMKPILSGDEVMCREVVVEGV